MIEISTDKSKLQIHVIHQFLTHSYWAKERTIAEVEKTIKHSLCFGVYSNGQQIGFARVVTDYTIFVYLMDVFVLPEHQGKGYSKQLIKAIHNNAELQNCTTWMLKTADAHGLYKQFEYTGLSHPKKVMERLLKK